MGLLQQLFFNCGEIIEKVTGKPWEKYMYIEYHGTTTIGIGQTAHAHAYEIKPDAAAPYTNSFYERPGQLLPYDKC